ncbi:MAG TPA: acyl-CoA dehydrogenase family protein [Steroidobacteraceae bacterium]|nr:acyl-CoA dehydrogenase family protein [Steroidobacteraceae bacterium]
MSPPDRRAARSARRAGHTVQPTAGAQDGPGAGEPTLDALDFLGLDAELTEEERTVRDTVARLVSARVLPIIAECFESARFPAELIPAIGELGLFGSSLQGHGCAGLNATSYGLICRELERGDSALRSLVSVQSSLCMYPIDAYGSEAQRERWLPAMARGQSIGCFGLTEAHGGSDPGHMRSVARRAGPDWVLNGSKMWITNGPIAHVALVWAQTPEGVRGFLVERGTRGFSAREVQHKFSLRASSTGALFFDEVRLPAEAMLPGALGLRAPLSCLSHARFGIGWGALGAAQACLAEALEHCGQRVLFGRPLAHTQAVQIRLAEMVRALATAQLLALHLARRKDLGELDPAPICLGKWHSCRVALDIARECRDLLGAAGISAEHVSIRHLLNLESVVTYEGTQTIHQLAVGRAVTGVAAF